MPSLRRKILRLYRAETLNIRKNSLQEYNTGGFNLETACVVL